VARDVYQIAGGELPTRDDFLTSRDPGKPLRNPSRRREWSEAVSVYGDFGYAASRVRRSQFRIGRFILRLTIPDDVTVELIQTGGDRRHLSLFASIEQLMAWSDERAVDVTVPGDPS